jgi:hypothetical protein
MRTPKLLFAGLAGAAVLGLAAAPAFAAGAHQPQAALTANQIAKKANADFQAASSIYLWARVSVHGITTTATETIAPQGCLFTTNGGPGFSMQILIVGGSTWIMLSNQTWQALGYTGSDLSEVEGKWVTLAAWLQAFSVPNAPAGAPGCHAHQPSGLPSHGWTLGKKMIKVSGRWAWQLSQRLSKHVLVQAAVSDTRTPEFVAITLLGVTEYLSHYNAPVTLAAPPASDVITSLPPLPTGTGTPAAGNLVRADRLIAGAGLVPGLALPAGAPASALASAEPAGGASGAGSAGGASGAGSAGGPLAGLTANQIAIRALHDLTSATSVHFSVSTKQAGLTISGSITLTRTGCDGVTSLTGFGQVQFVQIGKTGWTLLTKQFLKQLGYSQAQITHYAGKWLKDDPMTSNDTGQLCTIRQFSQGFPTKGWAMVRVTTLSGHRVVQIVNKKQKVTATVSDSARPEFVKFTADGATASFSGYNARVKISPPPAKLVVSSLPPPPGL